jgi:hypothetical protein
MKGKHHFFLIALALCLGGCLFASRPGSHVWFYTFGSGRGVDSLTPVSFLELRPDGSYSSDFGRYEFGHWETKDKQLLPPRWKNYFFDDDDCRKANDILKDIFEHQTIAWSNSNSKYKMFPGAFQQLEGFLR